MSKISDKNIQQIKENILRILFDEYPKSLFTSQISNAEARDKEFILKLLLELETNNIVKRIKSPKSGNNYLRKKRWVMNNKVYDQYKTLLNE